MQRIFCGYCMVPVSFVLEIVELTQILSQVPKDLRYLHLQSKYQAMDTAEAH
jgi:hypothetical protein